MVEQRFRGEVALVTGCASGIGRAGARPFAAEGASVVVADVAITAGEETAHLIEIQVGCSREGGASTIWSAHPWWRNLRDGARAAAPAEAARLATRRGLTGAGRRIGVARAAPSPPSPDAIARAMQGRAVGRLTLDGRSERGGV
jgi:hypothetical protein